MIDFWLGVVYMILVGDFPGFAVMGVHEDSAALDWVYQAACMAGHDNMCA